MQHDNIHQIQKTEPQHSPQKYNQKNNQQHNFTETNSKHEEKSNYNNNEDKSQFNSEIKENNPEPLQKNQNSQLNTIQSENQSSSKNEIKYENRQEIQDSEDKQEENQEQIKNQYKQQLQQMQNQLKQQNEEIQKQQQNKINKDNQNIYKNAEINNDDYNYSQNVQKQQQIQQKLSQYINNDIFQAENDENVCDYNQKQYKKSINILSLAKLQFENSDLFSHEIFSEQFQNNYLEQLDSQNYHQIKEDLQITQAQIQQIQQQQQQQDLENSQSQNQNSDNQAENQDLKNLQKQEENLLNQLQEEENLRKNNIQQIREELSEEEKEDLCIQVQVLQFSAKCNLILKDEEKFLNFVKKCQLLGEICFPLSEEYLWQMNCDLSDYEVQNSNLNKALEYQLQGLEILSSLDKNDEQLEQREKLEKILKQMKGTYNAATLYFQEYGKYELDNLQQILKLMNQKQDGITSSKIKILRQIFYYYFESQDYIQAVQQLEQIETQEKQLYGETSIFVARTLKKMGIIQLLLKQYPEAQQTFMQSKTIFSLYPNERQQLEDINKNLQKINQLIQQNQQV
ncbi:hypothetical protein PPERSA_02358 [Pseudocohnilembus persalinus]|uniref:Tetratricopeptide repeat protein n=1 Tax=Pseudocohnilembus persalinus TaxID=266149 RepID=A0A0V0QU91_PSEPJ|nr:hypothetical protein PPERSA_02358 [Pseudocohnilembus persalinus]|eukprot:KRX05826.1 hypothetical protein PPERSA_02358 [Pseudocohnilembus persalinus]